MVTMENEIYEEFIVGTSKWLLETPAVAPDPEICIACGACAMTCPDSAIRIERC